MAIVRFETMAAGGSGQPPARVVASAASNPAASKPDDKAKYIAVGLLILGVVAGGFLTEVRHPKEFAPAEGVGMFAVFYVATQALERLFELFRVLFPAATSASDTSKADAQANTKVATVEALNALATGVTEDAQDQVQDAADKKAKEEKIESNTSLIAWGANSCVAAVAAGGLGLYLLDAIGVQDVHRWVDVAVTSLVIGGGTKPLHDLIKNVEKSKEPSKEVAQAAGG